MRNDQEVGFPDWLQADARLIEEKLGMAIDYYGPPTWRVGEIEPLKALEDAGTQRAAAHDAVGRFPHRILAAGKDILHRKGVEFSKETEASQYDAPPSGVAGRRSGQVDSGGEHRHSRPPPSQSISRLACRFTEPLGHQGCI
jgi:hypothetical protein